MVLSSVYARNPEDSEVPWMRKSHAELMAQGVHLEMVAPSWQGLSSHQIDGISVRRFRYAPKSWEILTHDEGAPTKLAGKPWMQLLAIPYIILGSLLFFWRALQLKPDVLHVHWPFPHGLMALPVRWILRIPLVLNFHGAELLLARKKKWIRPILHFVLGQADRVLANSSFTAERICEIRPVSVVLSPYGTTLSSEIQPKPITQDLPFRILFVGRHIPRKGIDVLLHAAQSLDPERYQVRIVGHGSETLALQKMAQELSLFHVVFTGKLSNADLDQEYRNANVFVLPAIVDARGDTEGLGVVLIEAIELGLPVVASRVGGIPDVILHEKTGLLVPPQDEKALAQALQRLESDPELASRLVDGARQHVREHFSWEPVTRNLLDQYTALKH